MRLHCLVVALSLLCGRGASADEDGTNKDTKFDILIFAQVWPYSLCDVANLLKNDSCAIPQKVTGGWTIHGLWPSRADGEMGPEFCIPADHFDLEKVKPILDGLMHHWPNLIPQEPLFSLWQHEWLKHGTCAEQLPAINGELNYFQKGLQLNELYMLKRILEQAGIEPSEDAKYKAADVMAAMQKARGKRVQVHCLKATVEGTKKWYLVDLRVCFDKDFQQVDCPEHHHKPEGYHRSELIESLGIPDVEECPPNALLYYVPPRPDHYHDDHYNDVHSFAYNNYNEEYGGKWDDHSHDHHGERDEL